MKAAEINSCLLHSSSISVHLFFAKPNREIVVANPIE